MDVLNQGAGWQPEAVLASNVPERVGAVNSFSFDIGQGPSGAAVLRVAAVVAEGAASHAILTRDCSLDLQGCQDTGWSTAAVQGEDYSPSLRYGAGTWALKYVTNVGTTT